MDADAQAVETSSEIDRPEARILPLRSAISCRVDQLMIDCGHRVLPDQFLCRNLRAEIARARAHIAVGQLEPRPGEGVCQLVRVLVEAPGDLFIDRVDLQGNVRGQHAGRTTLRRVVGIRHRAGASRHPSVATDAHLPGSWSIPSRS